VEAVVLEGLRRHPPAHYLLAHTTDTDVYVDGYVIPKGSVVNYGVAEIGRDAKLWTDPDAFRPERFLDGDEGTVAVHGISSSGSGGGRETPMKMIPFGAGRRACPGAAVAVKVLQAFTEELIKGFEWNSVEDETVDMSEKPGLVTGMRTPFRTRLVRGQHDF
jgi:cytochrome P450 family 89 subfamily A